MKQIQSLFIAFLLVTALGCKSSIVISELNYQDYKLQVATANNGYSLEIQKVYESLYKSRVLNLGGVLDTTVIRNHIDSMVLDSMIGLEAEDINLSEHYSQYRIYKLRYHDLLLKEFFQKMVYDKSEPDSLEVVEYYYANEKKFFIEEQVDLSHILVNQNNLLKGKDSLKYLAFSEDDLQKEIKILADSIRALITSPDKFPTIATQYSDEISASQSGGYIGWTKRNVYHPPFDSVAFALRDGEIGGPYQDANGWHIIMVNKYFPAGFQPLNEQLFSGAKRELQKIKNNSIGMHLIDSLLADYDVLLNPEILDKNLYLIDGKIWGAVINGIDTIDCNEARSLELTYRDKNRVDNTTPEMKADLFKQLGERYVLLQAAQEVGIEQDSAITIERNKLIYKYSRDIVAKNRLDVKWTPSDSLIEKYFYTHLDDFKIDKPLKVQHIIVQDSIFGTFLRDQAMSGVDFLELAKEHYPGEKSIRTELADLGFISENDVSKEFYEVASKTLVGDVSAPVKTEFGYHIIKVLEFKTSQSLEEATRTIRQVLKREYQQNYLKDYQDKIFLKYNVESVGKLYPIHLKPKHLRK